MFAISAGIARGVSPSSTTLYRAVSPAELTDIGANGFRTLSGTYETTKLFATSAADAAQFGKNNFSFDQIPNTIVEAKVSNSVMKTTTAFEADGMKAVAVPANQLSTVKPIGPLNYSPQPTNPYGIFGW